MVVSKGHMDDIHIDKKLDKVNVRFNWPTVFPIVRSITRVPLGY